MRILTIVGARPQFIKTAPVSRALVEAGVDEYLVHTGQHYDFRMSGQFWEDLALRPAGENLECGSGSHADQTARMMVGLERVIEEQSPDWVLVYGDTNSTLAGALTAAKLHVPVAHVEAGLRSFNRRMPEEVNRVVTDTLSDLLLAPTTRARENLRREGVPDFRIHVTGDVMLDVALALRGKALQQSTILRQLALDEGAYVLATIHRAENTDDPLRLRAIVEGFCEVAKERRVVWPIHPRAAKAIARSQLAAPGVDVVEPVGMLDMIRLEMSAAVIATDSGGVQKEAFFHRVPCVTVRDETEWGELVDAGWNRLVPPLEGRGIADAVRQAIGRVGADVAPYGTGHAAEAVVAALRHVGEEQEDVGQ